jgi:outer membrane protein OmpA-like peptidoglycan-associated protein
MSLKPELAKDKNISQLQETKVAVKSLPVTFDVVKNGSGVDIKGNFQNENQMKSFGDKFAKSGEIHYLAGDFAKNREPDKALLLAESLTPLFNEVFIEGRIHYEGDEIIIEGVLKDDSSKEKLIALLKDSKIPYTDNTTVLAKPKKDSFMSLSKDKNNNYSLEAKLASDAEKQALLSSCDGIVIPDTKAVVIDDIYKPNSWQETISKLIPIVRDDFIEGRVYYVDGKIGIEGIAKDEATKAKIQKILEESNIPYTNKVEVVPKPKKDSFMSLTKDKNNNYNLEAKLASDAEKTALLSSCDGIVIPDTKAVVIDDIYKPNSWQETISKLIPIVRDDFIEGKVYYANGKIGIEGVTASKEAQEKIKSILEASNIPYEMDINLQKPKAPEYKYDEIYKSMTPKQRELSKKIEENISALLKVENITFATGKADLTPKGKEIVKRIANVLKRYPNVHIEIAGHTDNVGNDLANLKLSQKRVESVKRELINLGIDAKRLSAVGYGETKPKVPNDTPEHRKANRRVEFHIIKIEEEGQ